MRLMIILAVCLLVACNDDGSAPAGEAAASAPSAPNATSATSATGPGSSASAAVSGTAVGQREAVDLRGTRLDNPISISTARVSTARRALPTPAGALSPMPLSSVLSGRPTVRPTTC